ncbi:hypothetical protein [Sinomicrobium weinanense]|uniref:HTH cro/C1-type domain-containing protein n=1 Tax=Sinomicrobium weinanense TaxID=2842200 RepID=A0A926JPK4_9FLAO|nr:hypothetical protein [Sinomicrobium weinanense]MBC9795120.1 hypothetical protein [Sinomicrobium weinanense]MBU3123748.1 hypothetical protein [Sinomicrobium weinanense]
MKNNKLQTDYFLEFVLKIISKEYSGKSKRELETVVRDILGMRNLVLAESFYGVLQLLNMNIDVLCDKLFKDHKFTRLHLVSESGNKLKDFLSPFVQGTKDVASAANIENTRLSRLLKGEFMHLYPNEVYGLSKSLGLKPSQLFYYLYGDGERPVVGV